MNVSQLPTGAEVSGENAVWYRATLPGEPDVSKPGVFAVRAAALHEVESMLLAHLDQPAAIIHPGERPGVDDFKAGKVEAEPIVRSWGELLGIKAVAGSLGEGSVLPIPSKAAAHWEATTRRGSEDVVFVAHSAQDYPREQVSTNPL